MNESRTLLIHLQMPSQVPHNRLFYFTQFNGANIGREWATKNILDPSWYQQRNGNAVLFYEEMDRYQTDKDIK